MLKKAVEEETLSEILTIFWICTRQEVDRVNEAENEIDMECLRTGSCFVNQPHMVHQEKQQYKRIRLC